MDKVSVERTGNCYSIASHEYHVTFPDGTTDTIWSPPWNDYTPQDEDDRALDYADFLWQQKQTLTPTSAPDGARSEKHATENRRLLLL